MNENHTLTVEPLAQPLSWDEVVTAGRSLGDGAYLATVQADGRPHVAWVSLGYGDERLWLATFRSSQKGCNLRRRSEVSLHWPERPDTLLFARGIARPVEDRAESDRLWDAGLLTYDPALFFGTKDNPELLFVEITPTRVAVRSLLDPTAPPRTWGPQGTR